MSRLAGPHYHSTLPFTFPREPTSLNETQAERAYQPTTGAALASTGPMSEGIRQSNTHSEIPLLSQNRKPSLGYQNSEFRDSPSRSVHRNYRYFVVVIPPSSLIREHGRLGHTLSFGPPHRLSQGIVMPLFPTMYGQLNAIAKEFNFPSTTGLCLYLQLNEDGVAITPRISDESWHMLWTNLFDTSFVARGPPIGGRIEFDIDFGQARWYPSWLSATSQDHIEHSTSRVPSLATSFFHTHRGSVNQEGYHDLDNIDPHLSHPRSTSISVRHVPRKLSLVDRFDFAGAGRDPSHRGQPEPQVPSKTLSPIIQEDEPKSARHQLDDRVRSWRASAIMATTSLASSQVDPEPIKLPDHMAPRHNPPTNSESELNIEDFTWSISSLGPGDYDVMSTGKYSDCLPSPDIANRVLDDSPPTPSTATTWGAPSYSLLSPVGYSRPSSLDLGFRNTFSRPLTPMTMTSWGPVSPAVSAADWYHEVPRPRSVHLGERGEFSRPATPSTATSWGAPLSYPPTPVTPYHVSTPDAAQRTFDDAKEISALVSHSGPVENTWKFVRQVGDINTVKVMREGGYTEFSIYPLVYPNFDLYPAAAAAFTAANRQIDIQLETNSVTASQFPSFDLYPSVSPQFNLHSIRKCSQLVEEESNTSYGVYPNLTIYPAVYPYFDLYPGKAAEGGRNKSGNKLGIDINLPSLYPHIHIYSPAYPCFELYPVVHANKDDRDSGTTSSGPELEIVTAIHRYPIICPYASVYPHLELYPPVIQVQNDQPFVKQCDLLSGGTGYPFFDLYPPPPGSVEVVLSPQYLYPSIQIYTPNRSVNSLMVQPQLTQNVSQNLALVTATTVTNFCATRRRKSHWELREEVFHSNLVRSSGDTGSDLRCESVHRPQNTKHLRDNRRIAMTRSPTGPVFHRHAMPPAVPSMNPKASSISTMCDNADSRLPNIFNETTVRRLAVSSARQRSATTSSPSRTTLAAAQRAFVVSPKSTDSQLYHGSDIDVPHMAWAGSSRLDSTGNGVNSTGRLM